MFFPGDFVSRASGALRRPRRVTSLRSHRLNRLEMLEARQLLAANVLDSVTAALTAAGESRSVEMTVTTPNAPQGTQAFLMLAVNPTSGSSLNPAAVTVRNSAGNAITPSASLSDFNGLGSLTTVPLTAGTYDVVVSGTSNTTGGFELVVSLAGDIFPAAAVVDDFEVLYSQAALSQDSGTGNFVTQTFFQTRGIDMSQDLYNAGLDTDGNGQINLRDVQAVSHNLAVGTVVVSLQSDVDAPEVTARLQNDTGVSATDRITTDPTIVGTIDDESPISSFQVQLDNGSPTSILGRVTAGAFTLDRAFLNSIAPGGNLAGGSHTFRFTATDEAGNAVTPPVQFSMVFIDQNVAPTVSTIPTQNATEDVAFSFNVAGFFSDANPGDVIRFSSTNLPSWLTLNPTTGALTGTPTNANVGTPSVTVRGTDSQGAFVDGTFTINVQNVNDPPVIGNIPDQTAPVGVLFSLNLQNFITDPDNTFNDLEVAVQQVDGIDANGNLINARPLPAWLTYNATTGILSGTPAQADVGDFTVGIVVTDPADGIDNAVFDVTVTGNRAPTLNSPIPDQSASVGTPFSVNLSTFFSDPDGDALTFSVTPSPLPSWLTFNTTTGVLSGTPAAANVGTVNITVTARDPSNLTASDTFALTVSAAPSGTVRVALRTLDTSGNQITSITPGSQFDLVVTVQDVRAPNPPDARGVFSAFVDVAYNGTLATPTGTIDHDFDGDGEYTAGTSGAATNNGTPNALLDEVGGTDGTTPLGTDVFELFRLRFTAGSTPGSITFTSSVANDRLQHPILVFGGTDNVPDAEVILGTTSITVGALNPPLSGVFTAALNNAANPYDVNGDTVVSPLDALLVINQMRSHGTGSSNVYLDVNADGAASPVDALLVINQLSSAARMPAAPLSSGIVAADDEDSPSSSTVQDAVFANGAFW